MKYHHKCCICGKEWDSKTFNDQCPRCGEYDNVSTEPIKMKQMNTNDKIIEALENAEKARSAGLFNNKYTVEACLAEVCKFVHQALVFARKKE